MNHFIGIVGKCKIKKLIVELSLIFLFQILILIMGLNKQRFGEDVKKCRVVGDMKGLEGVYNGRRKST